MPMPHASWLVTALPPCRRPTPSWSRSLGALGGRVVRHLALVEDRLAAVAVPLRLVLLVMLGEQGIRRDVVAVDDQGRWRLCLVVQPTVPPLPWSARHSQVSSVITLLLLITSDWLALPTVAPPMREVHIGQHGRVGRVVGRRAARARPASASASW